MSPEEGGAQPPLDHTRQVTIDALCEHFANDTMSVEEFERRVDVAHGAASTEELRALLRDLPSRDLPAVTGPDGKPTTGPGVAVGAADAVKKQGYAIGILGGARRAGSWTPARNTFTVAVMGGVQLDFRDAIMPPGVTEVKVFAMMGGVEIIVPPGLRVESHGMGIMGGFEHTGDDVSVDLGAPTLRVSGLALMGGVDISVRHPGESARDARRRRRQERRELRRELRRRIRGG